VVKSIVSFTLETDIAEGIDEYLKDLKELTGRKISKSSIVEEALSKHLIKLEKELKQLRPYHDASFAH
jgi:hypothetical protein